MNFVALEMFANPIRPGHQVKDIRAVLNAEQPLAFIPRHFVSCQNPFAEGSEPSRDARVGHSSNHGGEGSNPAC